MSSQIDEAKRKSFTTGTGSHISVGWLGLDHVSTLSKGTATARCNASMYSLVRGNRFERLALVIEDFSVSVDLFTFTNAGLP